MSIMSYAQNFEDVLLWRALKHIQNGFYIDVGAQHPTIDSVSRAFYEKGWRGIHIEPTPHYAKLIRQSRPDEIVFELAISDRTGTIDFHEIPDTGLSTGVSAIAAEHATLRNYTFVTKKVECTTLFRIFKHIEHKDIHWLKIDVEGMELDVITGWGESRRKPWILIVESTHPNTQIPTHEKWERMLLDRGYTFAYFDGLSRFYVSDEKKELLEHFKVPVNIFDGFTLDETTPFNKHLRN